MQRKKIKNKIQLLISDLEEDVIVSAINTYIEESKKWKNTDAELASDILLLKKILKSLKRP